MLDCVLAPERIFTPTVAVIWVVAPAAWGHVRLKITPSATSAAAARSLIRVWRMLRPPSGEGFENYFCHISHKKLRMRKTLTASHLSLQEPNDRSEELHECNSVPLVSMLLQLMFRLRL